LLTACFSILGCAAFQPRPEGVSWQVVYSVEPIYPKSFQITAGGPLSVSTEELKDAWKKKAALVTNGRRFKASPLVVHNNLSMQGMGYPRQSRAVTGTITLTD
jgi:hypothetical protein